MPRLSPDDIRGGCPRLCQGAEEQVQDQALLRQTPTHGLLTCPDHPRGRQHGNVRHTHTHTDEGKQEAKLGFITERHSH